MGAKRNSSVHTFLHFNFCPCQKYLISLRLVFEPNSNICSGFGQQNRFFPVRMRPVLFQNGRLRISGRVFLFNFF